MKKYFFDTFRLLKHKKFKRYGEGGKRLSKSYKKNPLFTIITVVKNNEKFLQKTIKSVIDQSCRNFEYIIIDGGSSDNTLNIIKKNRKYIDYWISEKDSGLYYAFNKGMALAKGKYIGIINSDDVYTKKALKIIKKYFDKMPEADFVFGSVKKHWGILHGFKPKKIFYSWGFYSSHSTGFFIKKTSAKKIGFYDTKYKYHADYDYFYRMLVKHKMTGLASKKNEITGIFRRGGFSSKISFWDLTKEEFLIRKNHGQNYILIMFIYFYKIIKYYIKRFAA